MVVPFGVSVGDFIAGIKLVHDLAEALKESCSSTSDFRDLIRELYSLERALICVKSVIDPKNPGSSPYDVLHVDALKKVVLEARRTIDEFLDKNRKFNLTLGVAGGSRSGVRDWARRVEWARYKKEDVQALRWKVNGHSRAVNMILLSMQIEATGKSTTLISDMSNCLHTMKTQVSGLQKLAEDVFASNLQLYQEVLMCRSQVPAQVLLQEPVLFWDARGHFAPFHLEFVNSAEALIAVLKVRFKDVGLSKIEKGEFAISEAATEISTSFNRGVVALGLVRSCPVCGFINSGSLDTEIKCAHCGRYYQRITELSSYQNDLSASAGSSSSQKIDRNQDRRSSITSPYETTCVEEEDQSKTLSEYTRVRLRIPDARNIHEAMTRLKVLLELYKTNALSESQHGLTSLLMVAVHNQHEIVKLLLKKSKNDVRLEAQHGRMALWWAAANGYLKDVVVNPLQSFNSWVV